MKFLICCQLSSKHIEALVEACTANESTRYHHSQHIFLIVCLPRHALTVPRCLQHNRCRSTGELLYTSKMKLPVDSILRSATRHQLLLVRRCRRSTFGRWRGPSPCCWPDVLELTLRCTTNVLERQSQLEVLGRETLGSIPAAAVEEMEMSRKLTNG